MRYTLSSSSRCFRLLVRLSVAALLAVSLLTALAPLSSLSSVAAASGMPCCIGKSSGHCDSGLTTSKRRQPKSEPMCGLRPAGASDGNTIVAPEGDPQSTDSTPTYKTTSFSKPCSMDCCGSAVTSPRQQKREKGSVRSTISQSQPAIRRWKNEQRPSSFSSNEFFELTSPRGPPPSIR
jgi:hypothetical protein